MQHKQAQIRENGLASLDNTNKKGRGPNRVDLDTPPTTHAYKSVCSADSSETRVARSAARSLVKLLREKGDREPARKLVEGMLLKGYCVTKSRLPHAVKIVYETLNKDLAKV